MARILLIEDDVDVRHVMQHALFDGGYEVDATGTEEGGFELLGSHSYDLVIADPRLPDGNGFELAEAARAKDIRVLVITGYAFNLPKEMLDRFEFLLKPVGPSELLQAVEQALQTERI